MSRVHRWWKSVVEGLDGARTAARRRRWRTPQRLARFEALEPRQLLAADSGLTELGSGLDTLLSSASPSAPVAVPLQAAAVNRGARLASRCANETLAVPGPMDVHFFWDGSRSAYQDELGYFFVDGPDGRITLRADGDPEGELLLDADGLPQYVRPGDDDYAEAALATANSQVLFVDGMDPDNDSADTILEVPVDGYIAFYVIQDGTTDEWRNATADERPAVWFSLDAANLDGEHFRRTTRADAGYRPRVLQYKVEDTSRQSPNAAVDDRGDADFNDVVFSINIVPLAEGDDYSVFNTGADFDGAPAGFKIDTCGDTRNRGLGLLWNDKAFHGRALQVTDVRLDTDDAEWQSVVDRAAHRSKLTLSDESLHGTLTVYPGGGIAFAPDVTDPYWDPDSEPDPDLIYFEYSVSDGVDSDEAWVSIGRGYYHFGDPQDDQHEGQKMYLLSGGGDEVLLNDASRKFFTEGSGGKDIVLIQQFAYGSGPDGDNQFVQDIFEEYAGGDCRSVTLLIITTREQANDRRLASVIDGADALWFDGGSQAKYQADWKGTRLFAALARAAASDVAITGISAGIAILGEAAYINLPWDSLGTNVAPQQPYDPRVQVMRQGPRTLPLAALSSSASAPLADFVVESHFSARDRMSRLVTFAARSGMAGLGVDENTDLLIEADGAGGWNWSVYGEGAVYLVLPSSDNPKPQYQDHRRLTFGPLDVYGLPATDGAETQRLADILQREPDYHIWVTTGTVYTIENDGSLYLV